MVLKKSQNGPFVGRIRSKITKYLVAEFLKGATVQPCGRANFSRDCATFGFLIAKTQNFLPFYLFLVLLEILGCSAHFVCTKIFARNFDSAKKSTLIKSG